MVIIRNWAMDNNQEVSVHATQLDDQGSWRCRSWLISLRLCTAEHRRDAVWSCLPKVCPGSYFIPWSWIDALLSADYSTRYRYWWLGRAHPMSNEMKYFAVGLFIFWSFSILSPFDYATRQSNSILLSVVQYMPFQRHKMKGQPHVLRWNGATDQESNSQDLESKRSVPLVV